MEQARRVEQHHRAIGLHQRPARHVGRHRRHGGLATAGRLPRALPDPSGSTSAATPRSPSVMAVRASTHGWRAWRCMPTRRCSTAAPTPVAPAISSGPRFAPESGGAGWPASSGQPAGPSRPQPPLTYWPSAGPILKIPLARATGVPSALTTACTNTMLRRGAHLAVTPPSAALFSAPAR